MNQVINRVEQRLSLQGIYDQIETDRQQSRDYLVNIGDIKAGVDDNLPVLIVGDHDRFNLTETATGQLAAKTNMPSTLFEKQAEENPYLLAKNINFFLGQRRKKLGNDNKLLIRTRRDICRAVLSSQYMPLDNYQWLDATIDQLNLYGNYDISGYHSDDYLHLVFLDQEKQADISQLSQINGQIGDTIQAGFVISNSETGRGALTLAIRVYRLVCNNGMVINGQESEFRQIHRGNKDFSWYKAYFKSAVDSMGVNFQKQALYMAESIQFRIDNPLNVIRGLGKQRFRLTKRQIENVTDSYLAEPGLNLWKLANAFTRAAQREKPFAKRLTFESLGSKVLQLPERIVKHYDTPDITAA